MTNARERHGIFAFTGNTRHRVEVHCLKDFEGSPVRGTERPGPDDRRLHQARCAGSALDEPAAGATVRTPPAHRDRRRPDVRRGLRGPLRMGRRGPRGRGGQRRRRLHVLRRCRADPSRSAPGGVRTAPLSTDPATSRNSRGYWPMFIASWSLHDRHREGQIMTQPLPRQRQRSAAVRAGVPAASCP